MLWISKILNTLFFVIYILAFMFLSFLLVPETASNITGNSKEASSQEKNTISIVINDLSFPFPDGLDENHNPYLTYIEKQNGLNVDVYIPPITSYENTVHNILSSDTNLPDMLSIYSKIQFFRYVDQNKLMPLEGWIEKYGSDLKRVIPKEVWDQVTIDGHIYAIPSVNLVHGNELMYIRKDWLDNLKLPQPVTLEDYKKVIQAFTERDPDGNGKNDTFGFTMMANLEHSSPFFGAHGVQLNQWTERRGELVYADILPETKEALSFLAELYKQKWIDPDFPLHTNRQAMLEKIVEGKVGLFSAAWYDTRGAIAQNMKKDPKAKWIPLENPIGKNGDQGVNGKTIYGFQVVPKESLHAGNVIRFLNFIAGKGLTSLVFGFEQQVWKRKDGEIISDFAEHDKHLYRGIYSALVNVDDRKMLRSRVDSYGKQYRLYDNIQRVERHAIHDAFLGSPTPTMLKKWGELTGPRELFVKIVLGVAPIESFDAYAQQWKQNGGSQVTKEVNEWYKAHPHEGEQ
ncbi:extracellular solute-binding protein [Paenibacillus sp. OSY-SE]|uniref:extracellular solute-binding protein n=1 Tax=Paenibacillus sp. OSY-SE TaxID=1196323 RepID=UPI000303C99A|nr:extracellular solute-binding protein [Paenibacillus sp. OSY-SE]